MITHRAAEPSATHAARGRRALRAGVLGASVSLFLVACLSATPAVADEPETWDVNPHVSGLDFLLVLLLIPLGIGLVVALLAALPSMIKGDRYEPGQPWHAESEWFGGPRKGVEAAAAITPEALESSAKDRGGASARW